MLLGSAVGFSAGVLASFLTHPFDVLKTRVQLEPLVYKGLFRSLALILRVSGISSIGSHATMRTHLLAHLDDRMRVPLPFLLASHLDS